MMPSGHKAFLVHNPKDVELLLMHNRTYAAEYVQPDYDIIHGIKKTNSDVGSPTLSPPASVSTSSPRPRLSVSRSPTPRAVSPPRPKWNEPKSSVSFFYRCGIRRSTRESGFLYGRDIITLAITNFKDCAWHAMCGLRLVISRAEQEKLL